MTTPHDLKNIGLKATLPRLKILDLFEKSDVRHLTAEDVYKMLMKEGMEIGLATIYRVLTQFEQAGILIRHHFESGKAVFELNQGGHQITWSASNADRSRSSTIRKSSVARSGSPRTAASPSTSIRCSCMLTASRPTVRTGTNPETANPANAGRFPERASAMTAGAAADVRSGRGISSQPHLGDRHGGTRE